jgi:hypothetical protein
VYEAQHEGPSQAWRHELKVYLIAACAVCVLAGINGCAAKTCQTARLREVRADEPTQAAFSGAVASALRGEFYCKQGAPHVLGSYRLAAVLAKALPSPRRRQAQAILLERIKAVAELLQLGPRDVVDNLPPDAQAAVRECPKGGADAYDAVLREALYAHFISADFERALSLYDAARLYAELVPGRVENRELYGWFSVESAILPSASVTWHGARLAALTDLAARGDRSWSVDAGEYMHWAYSGELQGAPPKFTFTTESEVGFDICSRTVLERALMADIWCGARAPALQLYALASQFAELKSDPGAQREREYLKARMAQIRRDLGDQKVPWVGRGDGGKGVSLCTRYQPGYLDIYGRLMDEALYAERFQKDVRRALALYRMLRTLTTGLDGSTAFYESQPLDKTIERLEGALSDSGSP